MRTTITRLASTTALMVAMLALTASSAMAATAYWSDTDSGMKLSGTITIKKDGGSAKTCTLAANGGDAYEDGEFDVYSAGIPAPSTGRLKLNCTGSTVLYMFGVGWATHASGAFSLTFDNEPILGQQSPYGTWIQDTFQVPFTNAAGATPSQITFNDTHIGDLYPASGAVTATGTINVRTLTGGVLTLHQ